MDEITRLHEQLAAAQATNERLREKLKQFADIYLATYDLPPNFAILVLQAREALALPSDTTALDARLRQAKVDVLRDAARMSLGMITAEGLAASIHRMADAIEKGELDETTNAQQRRTPSRPSYGG